MGTLLEKLLQDEVAAASLPRLDVGGASDAQVLAALEQCFGSDDLRQRMAVVRFGEPLGTVHRERLYELAIDANKGLNESFSGASDHLMLPGVPDFVPARFVCPQPGCGHSLFVITLMVSGVVGDCPLHPGTALVEAP